MKGSIKLIAWIISVGLTPMIFRAETWCRVVGICCIAFLALTLICTAIDERRHKWNTRKM